MGDGAEFLELFECVVLAHSGEDSSAGFSVCGCLMMFEGFARKVEAVDVVEFLPLWFVRWEDCAGEAVGAEFAVW